MYRIVAQQFPNNETRVTFSSTPGGRDPFKDDPTPDNTPLVNPAPDACIEELICEDEKTSPPLSLVPNSKTERSSAGYGSLPVKPTRFGMNAKRSLLRAGGALEKTAPTEETLFLTGTLPGSTEDSFRTIASYSGYIVNSLKAWISTYAPGKLDFYVWEYQKRGALHLHYAVHIPDEAGRSHILNSFRGWWIQILHRIGDLSGVDMFRKNAAKTWLDDESKVRATAEICRKSVARYLAKYLSKSATPTKGSARAFTPSRWWGVSRPLKALTDSLSGVCEVIEAGYHAVRGVWEKIKHICDSSESVSYTYRHKVGEGETIVLYTSDAIEREFLWTEVESMKRARSESLTGASDSPSQVLRVLRTKQATWLRESLASLSPSFSGLRASLEVNLNWILTITPSTSPEPLPLLLAWSAMLSDIRYICRFTPAMDWKREREIQNWLDTLEWAIEDVAANGWR
jgi:hypothetical protein